MCVCEQGRAAREVHRGHQEQDPDVGRGGRVPVSSYYDSTCKDIIHKKLPEKSFIEI